MAERFIQNLLSCVFADYRKKYCKWKETKIIPIPTYEDIGTDSYMSSGTPYRHTEEHKRMIPSGNPSRSQVPTDTF